MNSIINYDNWVLSPYMNIEGINELKNIKGKSEKIKEAFSHDLSFSNYGLRAKIGYGTSFMNVFTVKRVAKGLANYIISQGSLSMKKGVVLSYDNDKKNQEFALIIAGVLAKQEIEVKIFQNYSTVAMLSYSIKKSGAFMGVSVSTSLRQANSVTIYAFNQFGSQIAGQEIAQINQNICEVTDVFEIKGFQFKSIKNASENIRTSLIKPSVVKGYLKEINKFTFIDNAIKKGRKNINIAIVQNDKSDYKAFFKLFKKYGIKIVDFGNNENTKENNFNLAFSKSILAKAHHQKIDILFKTDSQIGRVAVAVKNNEGEYITLNQNELSILLVDHLIKRLKSKDMLEEESLIVSNVSSSPIIEKIASEHAVNVQKTKIGFKFLSQKLNELKESGYYKLIFALEENTGFTFTDNCRERDAISTILLIANMSAFYNYQNVSIYKKLEFIYEKYGYIKEGILIFNFNSQDDADNKMASIRENLTEKIADFKIVSLKDYSDDQSEIKENCIDITLEDNSTIIFRKSLIENKLLVKYSIKNSDSDKNLEKVSKITDYLQNFLNN